MPLVLTDLLASKKFLFTILVTFAVLLAGWQGAMTKAEVLSVLGILWPVYLGAQGVADVGGKIAQGRVEQEIILREHETNKNASVFEMLNTHLPAVLEAMKPASFGGPLPPPAAVFSSLRPLKKGDPVVSLKIGPSVLGEVLEDVPEMTVEVAHGKESPVLVGCRFDGKEGKYERLDLAYVPAGVDLPKGAVPAAKTPSASS